MSKQNRPKMTTSQAKQAKWARAQRQELGLSQRQIADRIGANSVSPLKLWESGHQLLSKRQRVALCVEFDWPMESIFSAKEIVELRRIHMIVEAS
jgi:transcriptional regulator with XRE-family HTH domain